MIKDEITDTFYQLAIHKLPVIVDSYLKTNSNSYSKHYTSQEIKSGLDKKIEEALYLLFKKELGSKVTIIREEGKNDGNKSSYQIFIDPIDGTRNFIAGNPLFSVSVGLWNSGIPLSGVVYAPKLKEFYSWKKGEKSKLNGKEILPSKTTKIENSLVSVCFLRSKGQFLSNWDRMERLYSELAKKVYGFRIIQTDALSLCWVASGKIDAAFLVETRPFDIAGGLAICKGASCVNVGSKSFEENLSGNLLVAGQKNMLSKLHKIIGNL